MEGPKLPVYLDHHATTPVDKQVLQEMLPYFTEQYGNAASVDHLMGHAASSAVEEARERVAGLINARTSEIVFTSGATEADNLALVGVAEAMRERGGHIISCQTEHKAVLDSLEHLRTNGFRITLLPVDEHGLVDPKAIREAISHETILVSIMAANNEVGTIPHLRDIGRACHEAGVFFHTDAAQAFGHVPLDVEDMGIDLMSISSHKIYGPKGVGALYVRSMNSRVRLRAQIHGGGHERGIRSGTLNVPGIVGLGAAAKLAGQIMESSGDRLAHLRDRMQNRLLASIEGGIVNGHPVRRLPHNLSLYLPGVESKALIHLLRDRVCISTGAACTTAKVEPSHVLTAMYKDQARAFSTIRFGLGRQTSEEETDFAVEQIAQSAARLRRVSIGAK